MAPNVPVLLLKSISVLSIVFITTVSSSNILLFPKLGEGSHYSVMLKVAEELIVRGHNVTILVNDIFVKDKTHGNINFLFSKSVISKEEYHDKFYNMIRSGLRGEYTKWKLEQFASDFFQRNAAECRLMFEDENLMSKIVDSNFTLSVTDIYNDCPLVKLLRKRHRIPFVTISAISTFSSFRSLMRRSPFIPSYMPEVTSGLDHVMEFNDRLYNVWRCILTTVGIAFRSTFFRSVKIDFGIAEIGWFYEDAELHLINSNFALDFARPSLPNTIAVGGLTTGPAKQLSREWLQYLDSAGEDGVVLFSLGSFEQGIDEDVAALLAGAFAQIPQKVIWKLNGKPSVSVSANVKIVDWVPQNDLLAHPQIKVFVYHCGANGVWEAVYHGVPIVAAPLCNDGHDIAQKLVSRGMAVKVDVATMTSDELAAAIRTVANDQSFKKNAKRISSIFRDTPRTPTETAADWLEYVIRHGGAAHLRTAALDLNIFQYLLLDVAVVIVLGCIIFIAIVFCSCKLCLRGCKRLLCRSSSKPKTD